MNTAFALFALYVIWGSTYLAIAIGLEGFPPVLLAGLRFVCAGGALLLIARRWPTRAQWGGAAIVGVLLCTGNALVTVAEQSVSSGMAAVVIASVPLVAALLGGLFGAPPQRGDWPGLLIGLAGVGLLNLRGDLRGSPTGALLLGLSTVSWALGSVSSRRLPLPTGLAASGAEMFCGGLVLLAFALLRGERLHALPALRPLLAFVYLVVFGSMVAYSAYTFLLARVRPALATSYAYVNPAVAVGLGALVLHEHVGGVQLIALALILAGVAAVALRPKVQN